MVGVVVELASQVVVWDFGSFECRYDVTLIFRDFFITFLTQQQMDHVLRSALLTLISIDAFDRRCSMLVALLQRRRGIAVLVWISCNVCGAFLSTIPQQQRIPQSTALMVVNRRTWIQQVSLISSILLVPKDSLATVSTNDWSSVRSPIEQAAETLRKLVNNWERAVIDCTYADVPRELLEQNNKELLLEKASTFALFDKSVSVTSCKTVVSNIRDYIGRTGLGPVVGLEKNLKVASNKVLEQDSDIDMDKLIALIEQVERELNRADGLSYSARRDYSALNNFEPSEISKVLSDEASTLEQCRKSILVVIEKLDQILAMLPTE